MDNISDNRVVDYANQLVTPFFTRTQVYAFTIPPAESVIEKVNKGGQQDYIPHEYIRALLDRYIGTGRWEMQATLHSTDKEIVKKYDSRQKKEIEQVAATANVNVSLTIHAQDGSDKTLVFSAVGSNTQYAGIDKGYGAIISNAISSAESLGLKRAATNLGRAFGFDLKSKVKPNELPPSIPALAARINEREAARRAPQIESKLTGQDNGQDNVEPAPAVEARRIERQPSDAGAIDQHQVTREATPAREEQPSEPQERQQAASQQQQQERQPEKRPAPEPQAAKGEQSNNVTPLAPRGSSAAAAAGNDGQAANATAPAPDEDWELSLMPAKFEEWLKCIQTIARRVSAMTNAREIENFSRRHGKLIDKLPVIPGTDGKPDRNFKKRWQNIVRKRYGELGLEIPAEYAEAA